MNIKRSVIVWIVVLLAIFIMVVSGVGQYNRLISLDESVNGSWAEVEARYQQRMDLITNIVNTVKGASEFEQSTLIGVVEARSKATSVTVNPDQMNEQSIKQFQEAQAGLSSALSRLMVVVEQYPDIKSTTNFAMLQTELEGTENRVAVARIKFNQSVRNYNMGIRRFPMVLFARMFGFEVKGYFEAETEAEKAPVVNFGN
jgi:LemA protein